MSEETNFVLLKETIEAFLPLEIASMRAKGGPTDYETEAAIEHAKAMLEPIEGKKAKERGITPWEGGAELLYRLPTSGKAMAVLLRALTVLAFAPGGVEFCGMRFCGRDEDYKFWREHPPTSSLQSIPGISAEG